MLNQKVDIDSKCWAGENLAELITPTTNGPWIQKIWSAGDLKGFHKNTCSSEHTDISRIYYRNCITHTNHGLRRIKIITHNLSHNI